MAKILGLGGVFIRCKDTKAYTAWWKTHMGVDITEWNSIEWKSDGKAFTMVSPFKQDSDYFAPSNEKFMMNLRVDDVPAMIEKARSGGAEIIGEISDEGYGAFGWFIDPEGIKIELWQDKS
ncbi:MAG: VOC family protein [Robiginitomaculum sp.]|nr:VOC family protein [Robiginitomaculum sp.]